MELCMGMIADRAFFAEAVRRFDGARDPLDIGQGEIFTGGRMRAGIVYIARGEELPPEIEADEAAALVCVGEAPNALPKTLRALILPAGASLAETSNEVGRAFFEYAGLERGLRASVRGGKSLEALLELALPYFGNSLSVTTADFRLAAAAHMPGATPELLEPLPLTSEGVMPTEIVNFFKNDMNYASVRDESRPFIYEASVFPWRTLCVNIFRAGEFAARLSLSENMRKFRAYDAGLLEMLAESVRELVTDAPGGGSRAPDRLASLCSELLAGGPADRWRADSSLMSRGWEKTGSFLCASVLPGRYDYYNRTVAYYTRLIDREYAGCAAVEHDGRIALLVSLAFYGGGADAFAAAHIEDFRDFNFRVGLSAVFGDVLELKARFGQAEEALRLGMKARPESWTHRFGDHVLESALSRLEASPGAEYLCPPEIARLRDYDRQNGGEYLKTLKTYFDCGMNAAECARALYIHRATINYRLERIRELSGLDLADRERTLACELALRLMERGPA